MRDIFFLFKMFVLTTLVVLMMQVHVGGTTAEGHFHNWLRTSSVVDWIQSSVDGGLVLVKSGYSHAKGAMDPVFLKFSKKKAQEEHGGNDVGHREKTFQVHRHDDGKDKSEKMP